ncbi:uncharacterized protein LOC142344787 [Convolutriloba macropyga]|uniref:uncharacterized protein LOC142344787 n=1 Tax=Convolutriloba macropyga TaxID=536237 RepID=UPI003F51E0EB
MAISMPGYVISPSILLPILINIQHSFLIPTQPPTVSRLEIARKTALLRFVQAILSSKHADVTEFGLQKVMCLKENSICWEYSACCSKYCRFSQKYLAGHCVSSWVSSE